MMTEENTDKNHFPEPARHAAQPDDARRGEDAAASARAPHPRVPRPGERKADDAASLRMKRFAVAAGAVVVLALLGFGLWMLLGQPDDIFDPNAKAGQAPYKTEEEMQAELDRIVEEGMFNISIASVVEFADGTAPGTAYIENVPGNRYLMQTSLTLDDTGEQVYESKAIKPGSYVETITLSADLDAGTYPATATFTALDTESHEEVGKAAAKVTLIVKG